MADKKLVVYLIILALFATITSLSILSTGSKWQIRKEAAYTEEQKIAVANRDGANLGISPMIGAFLGICYTMTCLGAARVGSATRSASGKRKKTSRKKVAGWLKTKTFVIFVPFVVKNKKIFRALP